MEKSRRVQRIKPSATFTVAALAGELRAAGQDILDLGAGEPDFDTPEHARRAAIAAIDAGDTHYTPVDGTVAIKEAILQKFRRDNSLEYDRREILVSCGAKHALYNLMQALLDSGDEVIIPAPYWVSYPDMTLLADAKPVIVNAGQKQGFKITAQQLAEAITDRTKLLILNSPNNPTGRAYKHDELKQFGAVLREAEHVLVASDEIYEHIYWADEPFNSFVNANPDLKDRTVIINGVSKAYAMTGWRIGYAAGPGDLIKAMKKIQGQSTSNPASISQAAAAAALATDQAPTRAMCEIFRERHEYLIPALNALPGFSCLPCEGAFYAFPDVSEAIAKLEGVEDDTAFTAWLIENPGVAVVPGAAFGAPGHIRLSYATSMDNLKDAVARIGSALTDAGV